MRTTSRKRYSLGSIAAILAAAFLVLVAVIFRHSLGGVVTAVTSPLLQLRNSWSTTEVAGLRAQLASTTAALADRDLLAVENAELRAAFGRATQTRHLLAGIIARPPGTPYDTLLLDAGSDLGVVPGAPVFAGTVQIGQIDTVYGGTARATLYSAPGQSYQALLTTAKGSVPISVEGQGAGSLQARVPAGTTANVGDTVVFPGVAGALMAKVSAVSAPEGESFKTLYLHMPVNLFDLRFVYIAL